MQAFSSFHIVHCLGVGGIGISAVAKFLQAQGKTVSGSDLVSSRVTDDLVARGIEVHIGPSDASWLAQDCDLVIYSEAVSETAPERVEATRRGIKQLGHFDFLGELSKSYRTICITGTNGKSTTTAIVGKIFETAGLDPTVFVGSIVPGWELGNIRIGKSDILIVEGDEYKRKMLKLHPETTLITNIEEDHLEIYKDLDDIKKAFHQLCEQTSTLILQNALYPDQLVACGHERAEVRLFGEYVKRAKRHTSAGKQSLALKTGRIPIVSKTLGTLTLAVPGEFNMMNALGAIAVAEEYGVEWEVMQKTLAEFSGIWRRFERVGKYQIMHKDEKGDVEIISDYAHHPTAIRGTIAAAKEFFPGRRIVAVFEPHQHNRTKELFDDFAVSFQGADVLILSEIYGVAGRMEDAHEVNSKMLLDAIMNSSNAPKEGMYAANLHEAEHLVREHVRADDVVLVMGAGGIDNVARRLVSAS